MIVLIALRSIAFGALFVAPLDWQTKVFLGTVLLLVDFHFLLLDAQADENRHYSDEKHALLVAALISIEQKQTDPEATSSVQSSIAELSRLQAIKESFFPSSGHQRFACSL